jgi:hypothetical protein
MARTVLTIVAVIADVCRVLVVLRLQQTRNFLVEGVVASFRFGKCVAQQQS